MATVLKGQCEKIQWQGLGEKAAADYYTSSFSLNGKTKVKKRIIQKRRTSPNTYNSKNIFLASPRILVVLNMSF